MWVHSVGATVLLAVGALSSPIGGVPSEARPPSTLVQGTSTESDALLRLFYAWRNGDRGAAGVVADSPAVDELMSIPFDRYTQVLGCNVVTGGGPRCALRTSEHLLFFEIRANGPRRHYLSALQRAPLGTSFEIVKPTPSPGVEAQAASAE
jgi:hypothetical protein